MNKSEIENALKQFHQAFCDDINSLSKEAFDFRLQGKWNAGQQLEHIILSVRPVTLAFSLPKLVLRLWFGKANRKSRTYEDLVAKYKNKLLAGGRASARFVPQEISFEQRERKLVTLTNHISKLIQKAERFSQSDLDIYLLPHPLLGRLTLREMLYFTIYHVQHHHEQIRSSLLQQSSLHNA